MKVNSSKHQETSSDVIISIIKLGETKILGPLVDYDSYEGFVDGIMSMYDIESDSI